MNQANKLRWGILGAARINERMIPTLLQAPSAELVAIASRRPGAAAETLAKHAPGQAGIKGYDDLHALLGDPDVQAVYLPMGNHEHGEWALQAIRAGKHVLIEKPMALSVGDIAAIENAANEHQVTVMEGFMYRFHPQHARVREIVESGLIGEVRSVRSSYSFIMRPARLYRLALDVSQGGGAMWDIGPYAIHSARWCFDAQPVAVTAIAKFIESGADITTSGVIDFGDGRHAHFDVSFEWARQSIYEVTGTKGGVKCHAAWRLPEDVPTVSWWTEDGKGAGEPLPLADHFILEIEHFCDCALNGKPPLLSFEDAKANCRVIEAVLASAQSGQTVRIAD